MFLACVIWSGPSDPTKLKHTHTHARLTREAYTHTLTSGTAKKIRPSALWNPPAVYIRTRQTWPHNHAVQYKVYRLNHRETKRIPFLKTVVYTRSSSSVCTTWARGLSKIKSFNKSWGISNWKGAASNQAAGAVSEYSRGKTTTSPRTK